MPIVETICDKTSEIETCTSSLETLVFYAINLGIMLFFAYYAYKFVR